mmetsp:Transcript_23156/g.75018  ORF Transcript_23156/g.75018 Transcript_23156/m.75018 type:complete len:207 (+) Transcript_23156:1183-1803(+)
MVIAMTEAWGASIQAADMALTARTAVFVHFRLLHPHPQVRELPLKRGVRTAAGCRRMTGFAVTEDQTPGSPRALSVTTVLTVVSGPCFVPTTAISLTTEYAMTEAQAQSIPTAIWALTVSIVAPGLILRLHHSCVRTAVLGLEEALHGPTMVNVTTVVQVHSGHLAALVKIAMTAVRARMLATNHNVIPPCNNRPRPSVLRPLRAL